MQTVFSMAEEKMGKTLSALKNEYSLHPIHVVEVVTHFVHLLSSHCLHSLPSI